MNREELFEAAYAAFVPAEDDNPECVPFYRAWRGLEAAWGAEFCKRYNGVVHRAACECSYKHPTMRPYELALFTAKHMIENAKAPEEPRVVYSHRAEPSEPTEQDARAIFATQFKAKWPNERLNGKLAREKWELVKDRAYAIARERYETLLAEYREYEAGIQRQNDARKAEWQSKVDHLKQLREAVASLAS